MAVQRHPSSADIAGARVVAVTEIRGRLEGDVVEKDAVPQTDTTVAALEVFYDQEPENDLGPGDPTITVSTAVELTELVDRVAAASAHQPCPSIITVHVADNPYGSPSVRAGVGADYGYVQVDSRTGRRATLSDAEADGVRVYDFQGHGEDVPLRHEVRLATVHAVLAAYFDHDGLIPDGFAELRSVDLV